MTAKGEKQLKFLFLSVSDEPWALILFSSEIYSLALNPTEHGDRPSALSAGSHLAEAYAMQSDRILQILSTRVHFDLLPQQKWKIILWKGLKSSES